MGFAEAFMYTCAEEVFEELRQAWNPKTGWDLRGVTYERLRSGPVQWPAAPGGPDRNPVRYLNDGVSQTLAEHPDGTRPRLVSRRPRDGPSSSPVRTCRTANSPTTTTRSCSTRAAYSTSGTP